jgi:hypothetical protein
MTSRKSQVNSPERTEGAFFAIAPVPCNWKSQAMRSYPWSPACLSHLSWCHPTKVVQNWRRKCPAVDLLPRQGDSRQQLIDGRSSPGSTHHP